VTSDADGGVITLTAGDVTAHKDAVYQGYFFQAIGADVTVDYTLANPGVACDPRFTDQDQYWNNAQTVPGSGVITPAALTADTPQPIGFTALRLTFSGATELYIVSR
jgi:hypothetical protein